jgi:hypothetical protein
MALGSLVSSHPLESQNSFHGQSPINPSGLNGGYGTPVKPSSAVSSYRSGADYSFDSTTMDDVDTTRCFPFGMIFGSSSDKRKNRKLSNTANQRGRPGCPSNSSAPSVSSPSVSSPGGGRGEETMVNFTSSPSSLQSSPPHQQPIQNDRAVIPVNNHSNNTHSESFTSTSLVNTLVDSQKSETVFPASSSLSGRPGVKPLNLAEVQNGNLSSTSHSSRGTPRSPLKSDRSKSSITTTHGNLIINNSDEIISSSRASYTSCTQVNQHQNKENNSAVKSSKEEDEIIKNNSTSSQFPPDIRSKIRTAPLADKDNLHSSKKESTITTSPSNASSDNVSPSGRIKVSKKRNSPSPNRASISDRSIGTNSGTSPAVKGSTSFDECYSSSRNGGAITPSFLVNEVPASVLPLINTTSNDVINHNQVKPAVSVSSKKSDKSSNSSTVQTTPSNISSPPVSAHMVSPPLSLSPQPAAIIETLYRENSGNVHAQKHQQQPSQPTKQHQYPNSRHYNSHEGSSCVMS